jgi:1-acyl-sn-glycerol-3-phosphate acyltransferase
MLAFFCSGAAAAALKITLVCAQFARTVGCHGLVKIILKDSVKNMPVFGWGMHFFEFIFLAREWERDKSALFQVLRSFVADRYALFRLCCA